MIKKLKLKLAPKEASNNYESLHFYRYVFRRPSSDYGCRNGAKFNILKFYSYSTFIHSYSTFVSIQHLFVQNSTPIFMFNNSICSQNYYPFRNYLSVQQLFIHSRFTAHLPYALEVTYFLQRMNRGQRRSASDHWNFEKIPFLKRYLFLKRPRLH